MRVGLIGMNYKLFDLEIREQFAREAEKLLIGKLGLPIVLLSTCNRTEIYFSADDLTDAHTNILSELKSEIGEFADDHLYSYFGEKCFDHLAKVTSGLDSVILGEAEIQRQVKEAYEAASCLQKLPFCLHYMFQKSLKLGKEIRTAYSLPKTLVSMESTAWNLSRYFFGEQKDQSILFVGFSEINRKILPYFKQKGFANLSLATRSIEAARESSLVNSFNLINWHELSSWKDYDIVVCGSIAPSYLLKQEDLKGKIQNRLVIDLGLPRNVDPLVGKHPSISLFNIEEVNLFIDQKQRGISQEKEVIKKQIEERVLTQIEIYLNKKTRVTVCA
jgi:glutamyl-tRNA reductase